MQEIMGDMWEMARDIQLSGLAPPMIFITTNGFIKANKTAVMGRGCAREARDKFPGVSERLGELLALEGNVVSYLGTWAVDTLDYNLFSFPVKYNWWEKASLDLIEDSCVRVARLRDKLPEMDIIIPRPGCGNGGLDWDEVKPIVLTHLDFENVFVMYK